VGWALRAKKAVVRSQETGDSNVGWALKHRAASRNPGIRPKKHNPNCTLYIIHCKL
jgi:hypothetical protein